MKEYLHRLHRWYEKNFRKIVLLFLVIVVFTLLLVYLPFANLILTPPLGFLIAAFSWYILFSPSRRVLTSLSLFAILLAMLLTLADLDVFAESVGMFLFLMIAFLFINLIREKK